MAERQLPKLHTRVRFPSPAFSRFRFRREILSPAEESSEGSEQTTGESCCFLRHTRRLLCEGPLRTAMHLTGKSWYLVDRQIDIVSGTGRHAPRGGELIGNRADGRALDGDGRLQRLGGIMFRCLAHHLSP